MKELINKNKYISLAIFFLVLVAIASVVYYGGVKNAKRAIFNNEYIVSESPTPRVVERISVNDGRRVVSTGESVPLVGGKNFVVENGVTLKGAYSIAAPLATSWAEDAKLVYIRSLGTVTLAGVSSGWEVGFGSKTLEKGYVVSVVAGAVASKTETTTTVFGYDVPEKWYDAGEAIKSFSGLPQFDEATISGLNFYYNKDSKRWGYAVSSSKGTVSIPVR